MHNSLAWGGPEEGRCSKGLPIGGRGVRAPGLRMWRSHGVRGRQWLWALVFSGVLLVDAARAQTATVTLEWEADPNVCGYRLYYGVESGSYQVAIDVGPAGSCSVSNLVRGTTYYFAATAYSHIGTESDFSTEIVYNSDPRPPELRVASILSDEMTLTLEWNALDPSVAGYRVYYGVEPGIYSVAIDVGPAASCSVSNLVLGTTYYFTATAYSHLGAESAFSSEIVYGARLPALDPALRIGPIFADDNGTVLNWASEPGRVYRVLATETLTDPVWIDVSGPLLATSTTRLWTHIRQTGVRSMFYRVEALSGVP
jgi:hypothetical protein